MSRQPVPGSASVWRGAGRVGRARAADQRIDLRSLGLDAFIAETGEIGFPGRRVVRVDDGGRFLEKYRSGTSSETPDIGAESREPSRAPATAAANTTAWARAQPRILALRIAVRRTGAV